MLMYLIVDCETGEILADFTTKNIWCMNIIAQRLRAKVIKV